MKNRFFHFGRLINADNGSAAIEYTLFAGAISLAILAGVGATEKSFERVECEAVYPLTNTASGQCISRTDHAAPVEVGGGGNVLLNVTPSAWAWDDGDATARTFYVMNAGTKAAALYPISVPDAFVVTHTNCPILPYVLNAGTFCTLTMVPSASAQSIETSFEVRASEGKVTQVSLSLTRLGVSTLVASPAALAWGNLSLSETAQPMKITVTNTGAKGAVITGVSLETQGMTEENLSFQMGAVADEKACAVGQAVAAGGADSCTLLLKTPAHVTQGETRGTVVIRYGDSQTLSIPLSLKRNVEAVYGWGLNNNGQLGDGSTVNQKTPIPTLKTGAFVTLSVGAFRSCGVDGTGKGWCWGSDSSGSLGDGGGIKASAVPVLLNTPLHFSMISAGWSSHTCGVTTEGKIACWGNNEYGQLGDGTLKLAYSPVLISAPDSVPFSKVAAGQDHTCALDKNGGVWCWGFNGDGSLGDGTTTDRLTPVAVHMNEAVVFTDIGVGQAFSCGLASDGRVFCWGNNKAGQLGNGTETTSTLPVLVRLSLNLGGRLFSSLSVGGSHVCGIGRDEKAYCWGNNSGNRLGDGTAKSQSVPTLVYASTSFTQIFAGYAHSCALDLEGAAWCWGPNNYGQLGQGVSAGASKTAGPVVAPDGQTTPLSFSRLFVGQSVLGFSK